jgi:iron(III) transport system substrate-binding protein
LIAVMLLALAAFAVACGTDDDDDENGEPTARAETTATGSPEETVTEELTGDLIIYSGRREPLLEPVIAAFTEATGIDVAVKYGSTAELGNAIIEEQGNPRADVFVGTDAATAESLRAEGVFATFAAPELQAIPAELRADDGSWVGISGRARVIMYNTELVSADALPDSVFDLTAEEWSDKIAIPSTTNSSFTAWVSSLRKLVGDDETRALLQGLKDNGVTVLEGHTEVRQAVGRGEFSLGLVNHYYYQLEKAEGSPVGVIYPDQEGGVGVLINAAAASIVEGAPNRENAEAFMKFLMGTEAQRIFAETNFEYPLIEGVETIADVKRGTFRESDVVLAELGAMNEETLDLIDSVGLQ